MSPPVIPFRHHLAGPGHDRIVRWLTDELGWQPLEDGTEVAPWITIADVPGAAAARRVDVLLVTGSSPPAAAAAAAVATVPRFVVAWPEERDVLRGLDLAPPNPDAAERIDVGGSAGGVGTSIIAATLAAAAAWGGREVLLLDRPRPARGVVRSDDLESPRLWSAADRVHGVDRLRRVAVAGEVDRFDPGAASLVVVDRGPRIDVDVLVLRRDRAGLEGLAATTAGGLVLTDDGLLPRGDIQEAAGGRRLVLAPWSSRVARADLRGRVPGALPGTWVANVGGLLTPVAGTVHSVGEERALGGPTPP